MTRTRRTTRRGIAAAALGLGVAGLAGCMSPPAPSARAAVAREVRERTGLDGAVAATSQSTSAHGEASAAVAISEDDAVNIALERNAFFQEQLADLGLARADVVQAGLIANPDLLWLVPLGPKRAEATLTAPLDFLWLRGGRVAAARAAEGRARARLVQAGMDLVRDVRLACADLVLARRRMALLREAAGLRGRVAELAAARVRAGDALPLDEITARVDAARARQDARRLEYDAAVAEERLRALLGLGDDRRPIELGDADGASGGAGGGGDRGGGSRAPTFDADALVAHATTDRPDARSADDAVAGARRRAKSARAEAFGLSAVADYNQRGRDGAEAGPGVRLPLPLFNQNQGAIARADAELDRALLQRRTTRERIVLEVREAHARVAQAGQDLAGLRAEVLPALGQAVDLAERAYRGGETPLVQVLDASRQLLDARLREAQAASDLRRARAELERAVGRRLDLLPPTASPEPPPEQMR